MTHTKQFCAQTATLQIASRLQVRVLEHMFKQYRGLGSRSYVSVAHTRTLRPTLPTSCGSHRSTQHPQSQVVRKAAAPPRPAPSQCKTGYVGWLLHSLGTCIGRSSAASMRHATGAQHVEGQLMSTRQPPRYPDCPSPRKPALPRQRNSSFLNHAGMECPWVA